MTELISIACSLPPVERDDRRGAWAAVAKRAVARERTEQGLRLEFREPPGFVSELARLVQQEEECCPFLHFRLDAGAKELALDVTAPPEARPIVEELLQPADPRT
jgi:MerR family copper efflux transcriptional regulator